MSADAFPCVGSDEVDLKLPLILLVYCILENTLMQLRHIMSILGNTLMQLKAYRHHNFGLSNTLWRGRWRRWVLQTFQLFIQLSWTNLNPKREKRPSHNREFLPFPTVSGKDFKNQVWFKMILRVNVFYVTLKTWYFLLTNTFFRFGSFDLWSTVSLASWHGSNDQYRVQSRPGPTKLLS